MSLQELLAELQKEYLIGFPAKMILIESLWKTQSFTDLETEYHKLKGTGRTYGLPEVSQVGEVMERLCQIGGPSLDQALPLSLKLLAGIQEHRQRGEPFPVDDNEDFLTIANLVLAADSPPA